MKWFLFSLLILSSIGYSNSSGWNNYYYKVVMSNGKLINVEQCKQADRPTSGVIAGFKIVGKNVKEELLDYKDSMLTKVTFDMNDLHITQFHFSGSLGKDTKELHRVGSRDCEAHFKKYAPKK